MKTIEQQVQETLILQKVNRHHREAFTEKFPGQCDHILRLIVERLHLCLDKRNGVLPNDPATWINSAEDIHHLSAAMLNVYSIHKELNQREP